MNCQTCKHYLPTNEEQGLCRRYPPTVFLLSDGATTSCFPSMMAEGSCGEHKEKENA